MEIGTYVEKSVDHELSGNIIDLCPVGALNNKPYRYRARAWEMTQQPLVSPHDCAGTNLFGHVLRGRLMRVVPRDNEEINETWIADRDRFSCEGIYTDDRAAEADACKRRRRLARRRLGDALEARPSGSTRSAQRAASSIGVAGEPERDARGAVSRWPASRAAWAATTSITACAGATSATRPPIRRRRRSGSASRTSTQLTALLVVGSNLRKEVPIIAHRVRKAARKGAKVAFVNPARYDIPVPGRPRISSIGLESWSPHVAASARGRARSGAKSTPRRTCAALVEGAQPTAAHERSAEALSAAKPRVILLGALAQRHPRYSDIRALAAALAGAHGRCARLPARRAATRAGAALAGAAAASRRRRRAAVARRACDARDDARVAALQAYVLFGGIEPSQDIAPIAAALDALRAAECVVALTPYAGPSTLDVARRAAADRRRSPRPPAPA